MTTTLKYFAYGSNIHPTRFRARASSSCILCTALLPGYSLKFHKRGGDGSGKCNAIFTGSERDALFGVIYQIPLDEKTRLDEIEGVERGYRQVEIKISVPNTAHLVFFIWLRGNTLMSPLSLTTGTNNSCSTVRNTTAFPKIISEK